MQAGGSQLASLFAGVGIVKGSVADSEWQVSLNLRPSHSPPCCQISREI